MKNYTDEKVVNCISKNNSAVTGVIAGAAPGSSGEATATVWGMIISLSHSHVLSRSQILLAGLAIMTVSAIESVRKVKDLFRLKIMRVSNQ